MTLSPGNNSFQSNSHFNGQYRDDWEDVNDETRLLQAEPIPVADEDVPPWIQDNENVIIDYNPQPFFQRYRKCIILFILGIISITTAFYIGYRDINQVTSNIDVNINEISDINITDDGVNVGRLNYDVRFKKNGIFQWLHKFDGKSLKVVSPIELYHGDEVMGGVELNQQEIYFQLNNNTWTMEMENLNITINGTNFRKLLSVSDGIIKVKFDVQIHNRIIHISKTLPIAQAGVKTIMNKIISVVLRNASIIDLTIDDYDSRWGIFGGFKLMLPSVNNIPNAETTIGVEIDEQFIKLLRINVLGSGNQTEVNFTLFNIDSRLSDTGIIDDLVSRLLNDDTNRKGFDILLNNIVVQKGPKWLSEVTRDLTFEVGIWIHELFQNIEIHGMPSRIPMEIESLKISPHEEMLQINGDVYALIPSYFEDYKIKTGGNIKYAGFDVDFSFNVSKDEDPLTYIKGELLLDVNDVESSAQLVVGLIDQIYDFDDSINMNINCDIVSTFFTGTIAINSTKQLCLLNIIPNFGNPSREHNEIELVDINVLDQTKEKEELNFYVKSNFRMPSIVDKFINKFNSINLGVVHESSVVARLALFDSSSYNDELPIDMMVFLDFNDTTTLEKFENFTGSFISGLQQNITIAPLNDTQLKTCPQCNENINGLLKFIQIPLNVSIADISGDADGGSFFIKDTIMHVVSREVEMVLFNPISNSEIIVEVLEGRAEREGSTIGYLKNPVTWVVQPGIWTSPKAEVEYANTGTVGWKMIEDALRGDGIMKNLTVEALVRISFLQYPEFEGYTIPYISSGPKTGKVRWMV